MQLWGKEISKLLFLLTYSVGLMPSGSFRTKMQSSVDSDMGRYAVRREVFIEAQGSRSLEISGFEMLTITHFWLMIYDHFCVL